MVSSSYSTNDIRSVTFITNSVISHEWGKDPIVITILVCLSCDYDKRNISVVIPTFITKLNVFCLFVWY